MPNREGRVNIRYETFRWSHAKRWAGPRLEKHERGAKRSALSLRLTDVLDKKWRG